MGNTLYDIRHTIYDIRDASVAELADAPGLGPGVLLDVGVRIPSLAFFYWKGVMSLLLP